MGQVILFAPYLARRRAAKADPTAGAQDFATFWLALFAGMAMVAVLEWERA